MDPRIFIYLHIVLYVFHLQLLMFAGPLIAEGYEAQAHQQKHFYDFFTFIDIGNHSNSSLINVLEST